ncbi:hypothetical protein [Roseateles noduli]|uniref:hypothetical protein n=1 Tax=Roseateles noduli TaxID=2052484 RepID=UPI003D65221B
METPLSIVHVNVISGAAFDDFRDELKGRGVDVHVQEIDPPGPMASVAFAIATVVTVFVAEKVFGGMLEELGKELLPTLKASLKKLYGTAFGPSAPNVTLVGRPGKVQESYPYSLNFSMVGETIFGTRLRLLVKRQATEGDFARDVSSFLDLLEELNTGSANAAVLERLNSVRPVGKTMMVVYDDASQAICPIDPQTGQVHRSEGLPA